MATISYLLKVINQASPAFREVGRDADALARRLAAVDGVADKVNKRFAEADRQMRLAASAADRLGRQLGVVRDKAAQLGVQLTATRRGAASLERGFARLRLRTDELARSTWRLGREQRDLEQSTVRLTAAFDGMRATVLDTDAALAKLTIAADLAGNAMTRLAAKSLVAGAATRIATRAFFGFWGILGLLRRDIPLFGGLLTTIFGAGAIARVLGSVRAWHLALDVVAELATVLLGAGIAMVAFGVAASDAAREVFHHFQNAHTVMDAFGKSIPPATGAMEKLHAAVRPTVFQLLGDAISIVRAKAHEFAVVTLGAAREVQLLAARFTLAVTHGQGFGELIHNAVPDLKALGAITGNVGGILGALFRALPGYATAVFNFVAALTKIGEVVAQALVPVLRLGLVLHGLWLYVGLASTAVFFLGKALVGMVRWVGLAIGDILLWGAATIGAAGATTVWTAALAILDAVNPLAWVAIAAGVIAGLVILLGRGADATTGWAKAMRSALQSARPLQVLPMLTQDAAVATDKLAASQEHLAHTQKFASDQARIAARALPPVTDAYAKAAAAVIANQKALGGLQGQQALVSHRVGVLSGLFGGQRRALGLATAAGITYKDWTDKSSGALATLIQRVKGTALGFEAMNIRGGELGNTLQVMDRQVSDQAQAVQKANQVWDTFTGNMTSAQSSFDTVAQGLTALNEQAGKFTVHLGKLSVGLKFSKSAIDALTPSGIALNQAFSEQIGNLNTLFDSWRTAGIAQNLFFSGVKAGIAPLLKYAAGSKEATAQLVGLAQEADFHGVPTLKNLSHWLGNTHGATKRLKEITNQATIAEALLTGAMQGQGNLIASKLLGDINAAILAYNGVEQAAKIYGHTVAQFGPQSDQARSARRRLIEDLVASGKAAGESAGQIAGMISKVLHIPLRRALTIVMTGDGSFTVHPALTPGGTLRGTTAGHKGKAMGGPVFGTGGPTADDVPAWLSSGEYVMRAASVARYGQPMMDMINAGQFASGGLVEQGNRSVLTGQFAVSSARMFAAEMLASMVAAMRAAIKAAAAQAAAVSVSSAGAGPGGPVEALMRQMAAARGWTGGQWTALNNVELREAGYSLTARNPSGAYGLAQFINGPSEYYQWGGNPYTAAGQITGMLNYVASRYGTPAAAWQHELSAGWYNRGGPVRKMASGGSPAHLPKVTHTVQDAILALIKTLEHGSIGSMVTALKSLMADVKKYFGGHGAREKLLRDQLSHLLSIKNQLATIGARLQAARQYASSVTSGLRSYTDIGSLPVGGGYVGNRFVSGGQLLHLQLQQKLKNLRKFASVLRQLVHMHVPKEILREIVAAGPDAGVQIAQEILAGGPALMKELQSDETAIQKIERQIGRGAASGVYEGRFDTGKNFLNGLEHEKARLDKLFRDLGMKLGQEAAKWFGLPDPGGHHHHGGEKHIGSGWQPVDGTRQAIVNINGDVNIREPVDMKLLDQRINFGITSAGLGG